MLSESVVTEAKVSARRIQDAQFESREVKEIKPAKRLGKNRLRYETY